MQLEDLAREMDSIIYNKPKQKEKEIKKAEENMKRIVNDFKLLDKDYIRKPQQEEVEEEIIYFD